MPLDDYLSILEVAMMIDWASVALVVLLHGLQTEGEPGDIIRKVCARGIEGIQPVRIAGRPECVSAWRRQHLDERWVSG